MKIGIHHTLGSFSEQWIAYCREKNVDYKIVNAYDSDIVEQLADCDAFMWHHNHVNPKDVLFAKPLLFALLQAGKIVFPDFNSGWHFDDKLGEKYLFEATGLSIPKTYVFYTKAEALKWIASTTFPKVFKIRGGAGALNVRLVKTAAQAKRLTSRAFGRGFPGVDRVAGAKDSWRKRKWKDFLKNLLLAVRPSLRNEHLLARHRGYVLFQDFIPGAEFDIRINVVGEHANGMVRFVRKGDFRASGSGNACCEQEALRPEWIRTAFDCAEKMGISAGAFDFVVEEKTGKVKLVEVSYGYGFASNDGYWTRDLVLHKEKCNVAQWMVELVIERIKKSKMRE